MGGAKRDWHNFVEQQEAKEALQEFERNLKESRASDLAHSAKVTHNPLQTTTKTGTESWPTLKK